VRFESDAPYEHRMTRDAARKRDVEPIAARREKRWPLDRAPIDAFNQILGAAVLALFAWPLAIHEREGLRGLLLPALVLGQTIAEAILAPRYLRRQLIHFGGVTADALASQLQARLGRSGSRRSFARCSRSSSSDRRFSPDGCAA
jgi:hypothetical protein